MATREIKFRDYCGDLVGRQNGMVFIIRTEPGVIAGTPAHWVTVVPGDGEPNFSTAGHQYFHLDEAKEFCRRIAAGEIDLEDLRAQYDAEDEARILDAHQDPAERVVLFRARLAAAGLSYQDLLELEELHSALGETEHQVLLELECKENPPAGWRTRRGQVSKAYPCAAYGGLGLGPAKPACCRENVSIIPRGCTACKG